MLQYRDNITKLRNGTFVPQVAPTITVYLGQTDTLATLCSDGTGTPLTNPFVADDKGQFEFWADAGVLRLVVTAGSDVQTLYPVYLGPPKVDIAEAEFDRVVDMYNDGDEAGVAAHVISGAETGTHPNARILLFLNAESKGSGLAEGPSRAQFALGVKVKKQGFPYPDADDGEMDGIQFILRQVNGDAAAFLSNGSGFNTFMAVYEGSNFILDPDTFEHIQGVNVQTGVVNDREDQYMGYRASKVVGAGGVGISVDSEVGASWESLLLLATEGRTVVRVDPADGSLILFNIDDVTKYVRLKTNASNELQVSNPAGIIVGARFPDPLTTWAPTATPASGAFVGSAAVNAPFYAKSGKWVWGDVEVTLPADINTASDHLVIPTPTTPAAGRVFSGSGYNINTGQSLSVSIYSGALRIRTNGGAFPGAGGHTLAIGFRYREA